MKTEVIMKRELFGREISQKSKSELFSATDLVRAGNAWRIGQGLPPFDLTAFFSYKSTKEFIASLEKNNLTVKISGRGRSSHTWVHPFLFIDIALAISPELKIEVYSWLYDHLLKYRNESGDSYKKMAGALFFKYPNKSDFPKYIQKVATIIKAELQAKNWNEENERTLKLRDKIHENIALLCDVIPCDDAVRIGIKKALEE
jgi:hypothetical protein